MFYRGEASGWLIPVRNIHFQNSAYILIFLHFLSVFCPKPGSLLFKSIYFCCIFSRLIQLLQNTMIDPILASPLHGMLHYFSILYKDFFSPTWDTLLLICDTAVSTEPPWNGSWGSMKRETYLLGGSAESLGSFTHTSIKIWKTSSTITELP